MSEILLYSIARAGGSLPPPGISEPFAPRFRPVRPRRPSRIAKAAVRLRRFAGQRLLTLAAGAQRLGRRWTGPLEDNAAGPRLIAVK